MQPLYTTSATATAGREGRTATEDGTLDLALAMPKELGGRGGPGTNPEQLFAAGYAACFGSALRLVAGKHKLNVTPTITAKVTLGKDDGGGFQLAVALVGKIPDVDPAQAEALMKEAHEVCPYSKATHGNIEVTLSVE